MAHLEVTIAGKTPARFSVYKRLTSIGHSADADILVADGSLSPISGYIIQNSDQYTLMIPDEQAPAKIEQNLTRKHLLKNGESFRLGLVDFIFRLEDLEKIPEQNPHAAQIFAYRRLLDFSERIANEKDIEALLSVLLKEITEITGAEQGFLVLIEEGDLRVKVKEGGPDEELSDSIVKKVIEKKEAVIINDALHDQEFSSSYSVINYRLSSVMCVPLIYQSRTFGAIYVGNNSLINAFDEAKLELMTIFSSQAALLVQNALHINALKKRTKNLQESLEFTKFGGIIGGCQGMQQVFREVEKVAQTDISVLIRGEAGTGKELLARELHQRSPRKDGPFAIINCGALPENLLESELFGHVRGAFVGATHSRVGKFQAANNGTLYLEEIDEMPLHLQVKLLQAIEEQRVVKMGETKSESVNIRIIAASNCDLLILVNTGAFRKDLYYRLSAVSIAVPPLKERGNDVLVIANFFLQRYARIYGKEVLGLEQEAQNALLNYHWPGNVRQLENRLRRAVVMCDNSRISAKDLDIIIENESIVSLSDALDNYRMRYIDESLERNAGNRTKTANELGVDPRTIFRHLESKRKTSKDDIIIESKE